MDTFEGLTRYGFDALAADIRDRWLNAAEHVFRVTGRMGAMFNALHAASSEVQCIVLTCHERAFQDIGARNW